MEIQYGSQKYFIEGQNAMKAALEEFQSSGKWLGPISPYRDSYAHDQFLKGQADIWKEQPKSITAPIVEIIMANK